jgi:hypothetical protein
MTDCESSYINCDITFQKLLQRKHYFLIKKTNLKREQQKMYPGGKNPWGKWDYTSSEENSDSDSTEAEDLTDVDGPISISIDQDRYVQASWTEIHVCRNDGKYMGYICDSDSKKIRLSFPLVKRKRAVGVVQVQDSDSD